MPTTELPATELPATELTTTELTTTELTTTELTTTGAGPAAQPSPPTDLGSTEKSLSPALDCAGVVGLRVMPAPRYEPDLVDASRPRVFALGAPTVRRRPPVADAVDGVDVEMRRFAIGAVKLVLEVMNRRRPVTQLSAVAIPHLTDQFRTLLSSGPDRGAPPATLLRLHTQSIRPDVAEITVVYGRGNRVFAMGARVERRTVVVRASEPGGPRRRTRRCVLTAVSLG